MKIAICDSGVGGVGVALKVIKNYPYNSYLCLSDCRSLPYGNKSDSQIIRRALAHLKRAERWGADLLIVACNTMSTTAKEQMLTCSKIPILFIEPNFDKILKNQRKLLLFCTKKTAEKICESYDKNNDLMQIIPCKNLAVQIEKNIFNLEKINLDFLNDFKCDQAEVYLGCTHYLFLSTKFDELLKPNKIYDGLDEVMEEIKKYSNFNDYLKIKFKVKFAGSGSMRMKRVFYRYFNF